jgi:pimeloyl-ACP methyl ester carboxylesterase
MNKLEKINNSKNESKGLLNRIRRHKWRSKTMILLLLIFLGIFGSMLAIYDPSQIGQFRSLKGESLYKKAYEDALKLLPKPSQTLDINTDYGIVRVYEFINLKNSNLAPIVLLPGRSSGVPMWESNLAGLAKVRTVIALDALGDAGMSVQKKKIDNSNDQAKWLNQVFEKLHLSKINLVGHSFGGWSATNYALHYPDRINTLNLIEPVQVFQGIHWQIIVKTLPASITFLPKSWRYKMLQNIGGVDDMDLKDPVTRMIVYATEYYKAQLPIPDLMTKKQLKSLKMPVYTVFAENSVIHDSKEAVKNAKTNVKIIKVKNWPNASHSLPMEFPKQMNQELLDFISVNENKNL